MKRRLFVKASLLTTSISSIIPTVKAVSNHITDKNPQREFYELRIYTLKNNSQEKIVEEYFQKAAIPALNRLGSKSVGVFKELKPVGQTKLYVIIPFRTIENFVNIEEKLLVDPAYVKDSKIYLTAQASEPAYERIDSSLL